MAISQESHGAGPGSIDNRTLGDGRELREGMVSVVVRERRTAAPWACLESFGCVVFAEDI